MLTVVVDDCAAAEVAEGTVCAALGTTSACVLVAELALLICVLVAELEVVDAELGAEMVVTISPELSPKSPVESLQSQSLVP